MSDTTMTDIAERMARVEEAQRGLNTYLPLLLKRFEGIEDKIEADLKEVRQDLKADVKAVEQKLETNINETRQDVKAVEQDVKALHRDNRVLLATLIVSVFAVAASIYFT